MQPLQRCRRPGASHNCPQHEREWFCPRELGPNYNATALRGRELQTFHPLSGKHAAYIPPLLEVWERDWVTVNATSFSDFSIAADLSGLNRAPIYAVRYAWSNALRDEPLCCRADPLLFKAKPCPPASCSIMASGELTAGGLGGGFNSGLPANPFLARIISGRCRCLLPQVCDGGSEA
jgi:hypothetical protein